MFRFTVWCLGFRDIQGHVELHRDIIIMSMFHIYIYIWGGVSGVVGIGRLGFSVLKAWLFGGEDLGVFMGLAVSGLRFRIGFKIQGSQGCGSGVQAL